MNQLSEQSSETRVRAAVPDAWKGQGGIWTNMQVWKRQMGAGFLGLDWDDAVKHDFVVAYEESRATGKAEEHKALLISVSDRDWKEDVGHENGEYICQCITCGNQFLGHKRRVQCKLCASLPSLAEPGGFEEWHSRYPIASADPREVEWARHHRQLGWSAAIDAILKERGIGPYSWVRNIPVRPGAALASAAAAAPRVTWRVISDDGQYEIGPNESETKVRSAWDLVFWKDIPSRLIRITSIDTETVIESRTKEGKA